MAFLLVPKFDLKYSLAMDQSKLYPTATGAPAPAHPRPTQPWRANFFRRLPLDALISLLVGIGCGIFMVVIILKSDGDQIENWRVAPGVYLAIASVLANILLRYTFSKGIEISWWVAAMKQGTTVADLHNIWKFGTSLKSAFVAGRSFNFVALAAILLALVPANAPLAQRASRTVSRATSTGVAVPVVAAKAVNGFMSTGMITGRGHTVGYITSGFASVLQDHLVGAPIPLDNSPCRGTCRGVIQAAGYEISCVNGTEFFDKSPRVPGELGDDGSSAFNETVIFHTAFSYSEKSGNWSLGEPIMNMTAKYKEHGKCKGDLAVKNCTLVPATMEYRVLISNNSISLDGQYTYKDDKRVDYVQTPGNSAQGPTIYGGMYLALDTMFKSVVTLRWAGAVGYQVTNDGITSLRYGREMPRDPDSSSINECLNYWLDPTQDILTTARELAFRLAIQGNNSDTVAQSIQATQEGIEVIYTSDLLFLGLALMLIGLSAIAVVPLMMNWWRLGRDVSLSPIEIARAFGAPELVASGSNSDADKLMKEIGSSEVRYGVVSSGATSIYTPSQAGYQSMPGAELAFAHPSLIQAPRKGEQY